MFIRVPVKQEHIDKGKKGSNCECPIALALRDFGYHDAVVGDFCEYGICIRHEGIAYDLDNFEAKHFVEAFDYDTKIVKPFELILDTNEKFERIEVTYDDVNFGE